MDHHAWGKWVIHGTEYESVAQPRTFLLIILILSCECDMKRVNGIPSIPLFENNIHGQHLILFHNCLLLEMYQL